MAAELCTTGNNDDENEEEEEEDAVSRTTRGDRVLRLRRGDYGSMCEVPRRL